MSILEPTPRELELMTEINNLRQQIWDYQGQFLRRLIWGAIVLICVFACGFMAGLAAV